MADMADIIVGTGDTQFMGKSGCTPRRSSCSHLQSSCASLRSPSACPPTMIDTPGSVCPQLVPVFFEFTHPTASTVSVAGTFNSWHPTSKSMQRAGHGHWLKEAFLPPGSYEYCLVVDDQYMPDPLAEETVANAFGGRNSIVRVVSLQAANHSDVARDIPVKAATCFNRI